MASSKCNLSLPSSTGADLAAAKLPKPKEDHDTEKKAEDAPPLPQTLVRIPTQHAPAVIEQANAAAATDD
jgi:DASH complex subunit DAD2